MITNRFSLAVTLLARENSLTGDQLSRSIAIMAATTDGSGSPAQPSLKLDVAVRGFWLL